MTDKIMESVRDCCVDIGAKNGVKLDISFFSRQMAAGLRFSHPLVKEGMRIVKSLGFNPVVAPSTTQIAVPLSKQIPSLTLGITTGNQSVLPDGYVELAAIPKGMLQILMMLEALDEGLCDDQPE